MAIVHCDISEKYIPFLYKNFPGKEVIYLGKKIKVIELYNNSSSLAKFLRINAVKSSTPIKSNIGIYIELSDHKIRGSVYQHVNGKSNWLQLPEELVFDFNRLIRDLFEICFLSFMDGFVREKNSDDISKGINAFIIKYELDEYNSHNFSSLRRLYYRQMPKPILNKLQNSYFSKKS